MSGLRTSSVEKLMAGIFKTAGARLDGGLENPSPSIGTIVLEHVATRYWNRQQKKSEI